MVATDKIKPIQELDEVLAAERRGRKVVHCHGVFDLLHIGHIRYFEQARRHGDLLVVTVTPDRHVNKGPNRPIFSERLRAEAVASLGCVDVVAINEWPTAVEAIGIIRPDFYAKGPDYKDAARDLTGGIAREEAAVRAAGGRLVITEDITFSSTNLINRFLPVFPKDVNEFLLDFGRRHPVGQVVDYLHQAQKLRALVIGEAIIDEYHYCETLGKSGKEPILAAQFKSAERFAGGTLAIANHIATFAGRVRLVTELGERDSHETFVRGALHPAVEPTLLAVAAAPTIVKRRFIETYPFQKLFEIYIMNEEQMAASAADLCRQLDEIVDDFDVVLVADYGHGMLTRAARDLLCTRAKFLAVNAQVNAGNHGFNTVSKFRRADFISLSEKEIRLEARNPSGDLEEVVRSVTDRLSCETAIVTRGVQGSLCYSRDQGFFKVPGFAVRTVDRVGAGDAVFAVASLCVALGAPIEVVGFIGNAVGTEAVSIVGNQRFIERVPLIKHIEALLK